MVRGLIPFPQGRPEQRADYRRENRAESWRENRAEGGLQEGDQSRGRAAGGQVTALEHSASHSPSVSCQTQG